MYLIIAAFSAIGLFMSACTSYPVVAAFSTFVILGFLEIVGGFGQNIGIVKDIAHFLSIRGRVNDFCMDLLQQEIFSISL